MHILDFAWNAKSGKLFQTDSKPNPTFEHRKHIFLNKKFAMKRMMEELRQAHAKQDRIMKEIEQLKLELSLSQTDMERLHKKQDFAYQKAWQIKKRKMGKLIQNKKQTCPVKTDSVINLSDRPLTEDETFVLALGFNFQPRFPDLPIADIMAATEDLIEKIDTEVGQQLRVGVFNILHKVKVKLQRDKKGILRRSNLR